MKKTSLFLVFVVVFLTGVALADSIDPATYSATLAVGESVTVRKTVTIDSTPAGILDVMFMFDTSGSMGSAISQARTAANAVLTGLAGYGDLYSGVGYYSEPGPGPGQPAAIVQDLSGSAATTTASINTGIYVGLGGTGGDFPEEGIQTLTAIATGASWRPGSSRFIIALGDATFKESDGFTLAGARTALADSGATFIAIDYGSHPADMHGVSINPESHGIDPTVFATDSGGSIIPSSGLNPGDLVTDILAGVGGSFAEYSTVTLSDLSPAGVDVTIDAVDAPGDTYVGTYVRSITETFRFDITFTGTVAGDYSFDTHALVDGGSVAIEADHIIVTDDDVVPVPGTFLLGGLGMVLVGAIRRRRLV
jgi:hypothetical protein